MAGPAQVAADELGRAAQVLHEASLELHAPRRDLVRGDELPAAATTIRPIAAPTSSSTSERPRSRRRAITGSSTRG